MRILVSNDDGIRSQGIQVLAHRLEADHEVWIAAPEDERSGMSHSITLREPVRFRKCSDQEFACSGTPADCVLYSLLGALPGAFDMVISGINHGPNIGTDILYSGTAAAARQGALAGIPSVAVSVAPHQGPYPFEAAAGFVADNIDLFRTLWASDHFVNINIPSDIPDRRPSVRITHPSRRIYGDRLQSMQGPRGDFYYFLAGGRIHAEVEEGSDWEAVSEGDISVSPVFLHPVNHQESKHYEAARFRTWKDGKTT